MATVYKRIILIKVLVGLVRFELATLSSSDNNQMSEYLKKSTILEIGFSGKNPKGGGSSEFPSLIKELNLS